MGNKVTFDGVNKIVQVTQAPSLVGGEWIVDLDVKVDVYSDGKEDWLADSTLNKLRYPVEAIGGQPLPGSKALGTTYFLNYGWRIRPYEASHTLNVNGNLYTPEGESPFVPTVGTYNVFVIQQVSSLVDSTVQQLEEIEYISFAGAVHVDVTSGISGTTYPAGNAEYPVDNIPDATSIAMTRGIQTIRITGNITLDTGDDVSGYIVTGINTGRTNIIINPNADTLGTEFRLCSISGTLDGNSIIRDARIVNLNYVSGSVYTSLLEPGTVTLGGNDVASFLSCYSGQPGQSTPIIDCAGNGPALSVRDYSGGIKLINKTGPDAVSIDLNSGQVILDSTVTNGEIVIRGTGGKVTDNSNGATVYNELVSIPNIVRGVWNALTSEYNQAGSFGNFIQKKILTVAKFLGLK